MEPWKLFTPVGSLSKNLAQTGAHGGENVRTLLRVMVVRCLGVIFTPREPVVSRTV